MKKTNFKIDWIIVDQVALGALPRKFEHIELLRENNIKSVLSLCDIGKYISKDFLSKDFIHKQIVLPDHKDGKLPLISEVENCIEALKELTEIGATYVHCYASMERSPLICMAWIIRMHNLKPQEALDYIMQTHKGTSPLPGQLALLNRVYESR